MMTVVAMVTVVDGQSQNDENKADENNYDGYNEDAVVFLWGQ